MAHREARESDADADHGQALGTIVLPAGKIKVYLDEAKEELYAKAECSKHGYKCSKRRTLLAPKKVTAANRARGRPFGFLGAWLNAGLPAGVNSDMAHKWETAVTREERKAGRTEV